DRPELFTPSSDGAILVRRQPQILISTGSSEPREMSIPLDIPNAESPLLHYAGSYNTITYFYTKRKSAFLEKDYLIVSLISLQMPDYRSITDTDSEMFFHRQPYLLQKSGLFSVSWLVKPLYEGDEMQVNLKDVSLEDALLIYKDEKMFVLRKGR
ncbi:hypothetical protein PMAYCL1PPCAC_11525, partial [Pristionchus mayeri]